MRSVFTVLVFTALVFAIPVAVSAQPAFEVASVKLHIPNADEPFGSVDVQPGGRVVASGATLRQLVVFAYDLQDFQLASGGPEWVSSTRFDINAKAEDGTFSTTALRQRLKSLLIDRFELRTRAETRTGPVYHLTVASRLGKQLQPSKIDCTPLFQERAVFDISPVPSDQAPCQPAGKFVFGPAGASMTFVRNGMPMPQLARLLMTFVRRPVLDRTGLAGTYDFELTFSPDNAFFATRESGIQAAPQADGMSISTALREQLGLRLESAEGPVEVLVIERAELPDPD